MSKVKSFFVCELFEIPESVRAIVMNLRHLFYFWKVASAGGVARAGEELHVTPQTISGQIQLLERQLGRELFVRRGRRLELTEAGRFVYGYAVEIFALESELDEMMRMHPSGRPGVFRVGVADAMPKSLAHRLLQPALELGEPYRIICNEWRLDSLLSELAIHRLDLVIADSPIPDSVDVRAFNHRLGASSMTFFASRGLAQRLTRPFPACLDAMPMLLPGADSPMRAKIMRWLSKRKLQPKIAGEFDGSSLMVAFGETGCGVFAAPSILGDEIRDRHNAVGVGETHELKSEYFAISVERHLTHPCVLAITQSARHGIFNAAVA